jgi:hypothetical protein
VRFLAQSRGAYALLQGAGARLKTGGALRSVTIIIIVSNRSGGQAVKYIAGRKQIKKTDLRDKMTGRAGPYWDY